METHSEQPLQPSEVVSYFFYLHVYRKTETETFICNITCISWRRFGENLIGAFHQVNLYAVDTFCKKKATASTNNNNNNNNNNLLFYPQKLQVLKITSTQKSLSTGEWFISLQHFQSLEQLGPGKLL